MEEEQKQEYREHLINTIDMLINDGISIYDIAVVNKKAIRYNYILKSKVKEKIEEIKNEDLEIYDTDSEDVKIAKYEQRAVLDICEELLGEE